MFLAACMYVDHMCAFYLRRLEEGTGFPGAEVTDGYELSSGFWEKNSGAL